MSQNNKSIRIGTAQEIKDNQNEIAFKIKMDANIILKPEDNLFLFKNKKKSSGEGFFDHFFMKLERK